MPGSKKSTPTKKSAAKPDVPAALATAVKEAKLDKRFVYGLPNFDRSTKLKLGLVKLGNLDLAEDNDLDLDEHPGWLPLASLGDESEFLLVHTEAPHAVAMWEHEDGTLHAVWPSLSVLARSTLASKKDPTPYDLLENILDKVAKLVEDDAYAHALALLEPAIAKLPALTADEDDQRLNNLLGLALKGVGRYPEALEAFTRAGHTIATLNIISMHLDELGQPARARELAHERRERGYLSAYERTWLTLYIALAALAQGDAQTAESELRTIVERYAITDPAQVTSAREEVESYISDKKPHAELARPFLAWLAPKSYAVTPEQAAANRAWWTGLPEALRTALFEAMKITGDIDAASDEQIARTLDAQRLSLDDDVTFSDVAVFLPFTQLRKLAFYGEPETIEPLRALPHLTELHVGNRVVKNFAYPSMAQRALWQAAAAADRSAISAALAAGADINGHSTEHGKNVFDYLGHDHEELMVWLVEQGADPYIGNELEDTVPERLQWREPDVQARVHAAMAARGIPPIEDGAYRLFAPGRVDRGARFEAPKVKLRLDDGESLVDKWPANVTVAMKPPKKEDKVNDVMACGYDDALVSEAVANVLREDANVELLPMQLVNHAGKPVPGSWYFVNPLAKDCLVVEKCYFDWNLIDDESASGASALVIDPARVGNAQMFRPTRLNSQPMIVTRALAERLAGFAGARLSYLKR